MIMVCDGFDPSVVTTNSPSSGGLGYRQDSISSIDRDDEDLALIQQVSKEGVFSAFQRGSSFQIFKSNLDGHYGSKIQFDSVTEEITVIKPCKVLRSHERFSIVCYYGVCCYVNYAHGNTI